MAIVPRNVHTKYELNTILSEIKAPAMFSPGDNARFANMQNYIVVEKQ